MSKLKVGDKFTVTENHRFTSEITNGMKLEITSLKDIFGDSGLTFNYLYNGSYDADGNVFIGGVDKPLKPLIKKSELLSLIREQADVIEKLSSQVDCHHKDIIRIKGVIEPKPQLKQLDQSVFDGLDEKWRFAAVVADGRAMYFDKRPYDASEEIGFFTFTGDYRSKFAGENFDAIDWQNSLIERESKELTGSDLCRAMLARGDKCVLIRMGVANDAQAKNIGRFAIVTSVDESGRFNVISDQQPITKVSFAVPIDNKGEPLTASEAGF